MKKITLLLLFSILLNSCGKENISPDITVFKRQEHPTKEYYPKTLVWMCAEGDTLFNETLTMTRVYSEHEMTETSSEPYDLSFPVWQVKSVFFIGKVHKNYIWVFSNRDHTKSVTFKLLN